MEIGSDDFEVIGDQSDYYESVQILEESKNIPTPTKIYEV